MKWWECSSPTNVDWTWKTRRTIMGFFQFSPFTKNQWERTTMWMCQCKIIFIYNFIHSLFYLHILHFMLHFTLHLLQLNILVPPKKEKYIACHIRFCCNWHWFKRVQKVFSNSFQISDQSNFWKPLTLVSATHYTKNELEFASKINNHKNMLTVKSRQVEVTRCLTFAVDNPWGGVDLGLVCSLCVFI